MSGEVTKEFWEELDDNPVLMVSLDDTSDHAIPMTAQLDKDANSCFWFFTSKGNRLAKGGRAMAQFVAKGHDLFACVSGTLSVEEDSSVIDKHWSNAVEAWYDKGRQDPDLLMLRFDLGTAEIWEPDLGLTGVFKMMTGQSIDKENAGDHDVVGL